MLAIDDELEEAFYLRNDVTYFYALMTLQRNSLRRS